jgi:DNA-binding NarL/FixJ family response regulator
MPTMTVERPGFDFEATDPSERSRSVTVVLSDHDHEMCEDVKCALQGAGFTVVAEAPDAEGAVKAALRHRPEICLLETDLPGTAVAAIREIVSELPDTRIGMLAESTTDKRALRAIKAGADGVLAVAAPTEKLTAAAWALARGELPLPRALTARVVEEWRRPAPLPAVKRQAKPVRALLYPFRFVRHLRRRQRSQMGFKEAWASAKARMELYR